MQRPRSGTSGIQHADVFKSDAADNTVRINLTGSRTAWVDSIVPWRRDNLDGTMMGGAPKS